ncbi:MAG: Asp23/Gls24 family envelope stress response protein [Clostridia bacterium]|nr:Asp23/Gls24 family envelope stress response protein [Clostridia bacterium]
MARFKKLPQKKKEGKVVYGSGIVNGIVLLAVAELDNVELYSVSNKKSMRSNSIKVSLEKEGIKVSVAIKVHYSQSISEIAFRVQEAIRHNVEAMTEYKVASVDVSVLGVMFNEVPSIPVPQEDLTKTNENN